MIKKQEEAKSYLEHLVQEGAVKKLIIKIIKPLNVTSIKEVKEKKPVKEKAKSKR